MGSPPGDSLRERLLGLLYKALYVAAFGFLIFKVYNYHHFNFGYSVLPTFSQHAYESSLDALKDTHHYTFPSDTGYDGQYYAQLALEPSATGPEIERAMDNYSYRARRILFSWTAWAIGFGDPYWILQAYGIQNALFWFLTALVLLRWLPPNTWQNALRFLSCFFTVGLVYSFNRALLDGPSLFLIVLGAACIEANRSWLGAAILGLAGLGKETNLLAVTALWSPTAKGAKTKAGIILRIALAILPFIVWYGYILSSNTIGISGTMGRGNFALPLFGFFEAALDILKKGGETGFQAKTFIQFAMLASLLTQAAYLLFRPKPDRVWWRIGVTFAILMLVLGHAVWENVEAAPRVLLPMTIAFNLLFSRKLVLLPILIFANSLSIVGLFSLHPSFPPERFDMQGRSNLAYNPQTNEYSSLEFPEGWSINEGDQGRYWRWSSGGGEMTFRIPGDQDVNAAFAFITKTIDARDLVLEVNGEIVWRIRSEGGYSKAQKTFFKLQAGDNFLKLSSPQSPIRIGDDPRDLSFALYDYQIELLSIAKE